MADLQALIRMHRYDLDGRRRALADLYGSLKKVEREIRDLEQSIEKETEAADTSGLINFTFAQYLEASRTKMKSLVQAAADLERRIDTAKDELIEVFAEVKKYEMAQAAREKRESAAAAAQETKMMDEIGLEGFRRKDESS